MTDLPMWTVVSAAGLAAVMVMTLAALKGWRDWLALQRFSIEGRQQADGRAVPGTGGRIELADLKERVRRLEAIAAGVEL